MSVMILRLAIIAALAMMPVAAHAQSAPSWLTYGYTPTVGQWRAAFSSKQDVLPFTPLNQAGGTMAGKLQSAPSTINGAGFSVLPGIAPTSPANGDVWVTSAGFFVRVNGQTVTLINQAAVAITGGTINGAAIGGTTPAAGAFTTLSATTPLPVASGGTGGSTPSAARTGLGAAEAGANGSITSLTGLTTPLSVGQGGTGATTASAARTSLGAAASGANTDITSLNGPSLGAATATTPSAGDNSTRAATTAFVASAVTTAASVLPIGQVRLVYSSATALLVKPYNGNQININGAYVTVPSAGVTCSNAGTTFGTLYYIYLYVSGGNPTCELVTTAHATGSSTGVEIKSGDATRTYVGMTYTAGSSGTGTFADSASQRFVASWFNRPPRPLLGTANSGTSGSTTPVEANGASRVQFVVHADEEVDLETGGVMSNATANQGEWVYPGLDGVALGPGNYYQDATAGVPGPAVSRATTLTTEGLHYGTVMFKAGGGSATVTAAVVGVVR